MELVDVELKGFKRLKANNIQLLKITPGQRKQLIIGQNGCGKTQVMRQITPLPPATNEYAKGGYKKITVRHRGSLYELSSHFGGGLGHSFKKDGVELNAIDGTASVQKELVFQEFGITPLLHDIITGKVRFSALKGGDRRKLLTMLGGGNFDYATSVYNKAADRVRGITEALKLNKRRLVAETSKIMKAEDVDRIKAKIDEDVEKVNRLYSLRNDESRQRHEIDQHLRSLMRQTEESCQRLFRIHGQFDNELMWTPQEIQEDIDTVRLTLASLNTETELLTKEHVKLAETRQQFLKIGDVGLTELREEIQVLEGVKVELVQGSRLKLTYQDPKQAHAALESVFEVLVEVFNGLPTNSDRRFSQAKQQEFEALDLALSQKLLTANKKLQEFRVERDHLDHLQKGTQSECPRCNHRWFMGFSQARHDALSKQITEGEAFVEESTKKQAEYREELERIKDYGQKYREFARCTRSLSILEPLWDLLLEGELIANAPKRIVALLGQARQDLKELSDLEGVEDQLQKRRAMEELLIKASDTDISKMMARMEEIEEHMGQLTTRIGNAQNRVKSLTQDKQRTETLLTLEKEVRELSRQIDAGMHDMARALNNEAVNSCLRVLQLGIAERQKTLNDIQMQQGIINDIQTTIGILEEEEEAYKLIVSELSPKDGMIAEGLLGFIRVFVEKMNRVITQVWSYPMEVLPCSAPSDDNVELDYKFPIVIRGEEGDPVPDIEDGSTGMRDIIDLAAKVVIMAYAGLKDHWLMLDEFGSGFDHGHRAKATAMIESLMDHLPFTQLFMVSHHFVEYASLTGAEVCVLAPDNVILPQTYNTHVVMQ